MDNLLLLCVTGWLLATDGISSPSPKAFADHFEMSSRMVDAIVEYKVSDAGVWSRGGQIRFPVLRAGKDDTYGSWKVPMMPQAEVKVDRRALSPGVVQDVRIGPALSVIICHADEGIQVRRDIFPAQTACALLERIAISNMTERTKMISVSHRVSEVSSNGVFGGVVCTYSVAGAGDCRLAAGQSVEYCAVAHGRGENDPCYFPDVASEWASRMELWRRSGNLMTLETPSPEMNMLFRMVKFRSMESCYFTRAGVIHSPGGYNRYLASIWANDQMEYACPFLAMMGDATAVEAAKTCCRWFARRMNKAFESIPSSIIAEDRGFWNGAGDRGDQAMMAHGATRVALACGDIDFAREIEPFVAWCLEFSRRKKTLEGVVASDSDELEGRLPAGKANLCTSALHYDALLRGADLLDALGFDRQRAADYRLRASRLADAIQRVFARSVEGYETYRYYEGNDVLRSWIAIPLCFGINTRSSGTVDAVFSPRLWDGTGLRSVSTASGYWDRSTLYAFRGAFFAGYADAALPYLKDYTSARLLGKHVPYPIEAVPEGNASHLAAESALYARVFTEGVLGITPVGLGAFHIKPSLPKAWNRVALRRIRAFGAMFDIELLRDGPDIRLNVYSGSPLRCCRTEVFVEGGGCTVKVDW